MSSNTAYSASAMFSSRLNSPPKYAWRPSDRAHVVFPVRVGPYSTRDFPLILADSVRFLCTREGGGGSPRASEARAGTLSSGGVPLLDVRLLTWFCRSCKVLLCPCSEFWKWIKVEQYVAVMLIRLWINPISPIGVLLQSRE